MIDLRSDTVTKPSTAMREAMARAEVGDDVFGEDPTVHALEEEIAGLTGKEAALFVPSGSMGNQLAIACQTQPGDEVVVGEGAHPVTHECGAGPALSGVQFAQVGTGGLFTADDMERAVRPKAYWVPRSSLVGVENTNNRGGGRVFPPKDAREIAERAHALGLAAHLDGARLWNASAALGISIKELAAPFDTVTLCFSKGLGAPVGSALAGTRALVERARRLRKMWGGGMRQSGILAAGALYALAHNRARLVEDHANAKSFAEALVGCPHLAVDVGSVETNIVNVDVLGSVSADEVSTEARTRGLAINSSAAKRLRAVTHLDVSRDAVVEAARRLREAAERAAAAVAANPKRAGAPRA
jgi:threonine aldolase